MTRTFLLAGLLVAIVFSTAAHGSLGSSYTPPAGFVPDSATALKVAEAVLTPVYGEAHIIAERPFGASLAGDVWTVVGTLHCAAPPPAACKGGVAEVHISKKSGEILAMSHGK